MKTMITNIEKYKEDECPLILEEIIKDVTPMAIALASKYIKLTHSYEMQDLISEALMEVPSAVNKYQTNSEAKFTTYIYILMRNKMLSHVRKDNAQKRHPGNYAILESAIGSMASLTYQEVLHDESSIEYDLIKKEKEEVNIAKLKEVLNELEFEIYYDHLHGLSTPEIMEKHNITRVQFFNKLNYIRKKLRNKLKKT